jgi:hypothetical protein
MHILSLSRKDFSDWVPSMFKYWGWILWIVMISAPTPAFITNTKNFFVMCPLLPGGHWFEHFANLFIIYKSNLIYLLYLLL